MLVRYTIWNRLRREFNSYVKYIRTILLYRPALDSPKNICREMTVLNFTSKTVGTRKAS